MTSSEASTEASPSRLERRPIPTMPTQAGMRSVPAWAVSFLLHSTILTVIALFWVAQPSGTGGQADRPIGVAVVYEASEGEEYLVGDSSSGGATADSDSENLSESLPTVSDALGPNAEVLNDLLPQGTNAGGGAGDAIGDLGLGEGDTQLGGSRETPKARTSVFGIEGEGTRFVYVFDRSESMDGYGGAPFRAAKSQLLQSLESLGLAHQFQIIFYNDTPLPFGGMGNQGPRLLTGDEQDKRSAQRFVRNVIAAGGTQHIEALRMAMNMSPDVIFFLTDAEAAPFQRDLDRLIVRASRVGATIHTIQFGKGGNQLGGGWIKFLADESGGKYRYIDLTSLGEDDSY